MGKKKNNRAPRHERIKKKKMMTEQGQRWVSIRKRPIYRFMKDAIHDALEDYWSVVNENVVVWTQHHDACDMITLKTYRLMKYIRKEYGGINECVDDKLIDDTMSAAMVFYNLHEDGRTSYQDESDALEILSRAAFREMKGLKKLKQEIDEETWHNN